MVSVQLALKVTLRAPLDKRNAPHVRLEVIKRLLAQCLVISAQLDLNLEPRASRHAQVVIQETSRRVALVLPVLRDHIKLCMVKDLVSIVKSGSTNWHLAAQVVLHVLEDKHHHLVVKGALTVLPERIRQLEYAQIAHQGSTSPIKAKASVYPVNLGNISQALRRQLAIDALRDMSRPAMPNPVLPVLPENIQIKLMPFCVETVRQEPTKLSLEKMCVINVRKDSIRSSRRQSLACPAPLGTPPILWGRLHVRPVVLASFLLMDCATIAQVATIRLSPARHLVLHALSASIKNNLGP